MKNCILSIILLVFSQILFAQDAVTIIANTKNKYENLNSYFDSGKLVTSFYNIANPSSSAKFFKTSYTKSGLFNFEYYNLGQSNSLYVINRGTDKKVQSWWGVTNKLESYTSLQLPLAAATGVSSLTSTIIPSLLLSGQDSFLPKSLLNTLVNPIFSAMEVINGTSCFKIVATNKQTKLIEVWIGEKDFFIHKIITDQNIKDFSVKHIYLFYPYELKVISNETFAFRPNRQIEL